MSTPSDPTIKLNETVKKRGFVTQAHYLRYQTSHEIERRLGYRNGLLDQGWALLFLQQLPEPGEFELCGYTYFSGGVEQGHLANPSDPRGMEKRLTDDNFDVKKIKQTVLSRAFCILGDHRLAKVVPNIKPNGEKENFPPGLGIPQWRLITDLPFRVAAIMDCGQMYTGDYT